MEITENQPGFAAATIRVGPDPDQAFRDILRALKIDEHEGADDEMYESWLAGNCSGCYSCQAAFIARAALERKNYPPMRWYDDDAA